MPIVNPNSFPHSVSRAYSTNRGFPQTQRGFPQEKCGKVGKIYSSGLLTKPLNYYIIIKTTPHNSVELCENCAAVTKKQEDLNMVTANIQLKEINDVYKLVNILIGFDGDVDLESGRYKVDGKSILGIFSLDLRGPIKLIYEGDTGAEELLEKIKPFIVD